MFAFALRSVNLKLDKILGSNYLLSQNSCSRNQGLGIDFQNQLYVPCRWAI